MELHPLQEGPRGFVELQKNHLTNPMPKQFNTCKAKFCVQESPDTMRTKKKSKNSTHRCPRVSCVCTEMFRCLKFNIDSRKI
jgi:hypothetical protein